MNIAAQTWKSQRPPISSAPVRSCAVLKRALASREYSSCSTSSATRRQVNNPSLPYERLHTVLLRPEPQQRLRELASLAQHTAPRRARRPAHGARSSSILLHTKEIRAKKRLQSTRHLRLVRQLTRAQRGQHGEDPIGRRAWRVDRRRLRRRGFGLGVIFREQRSALTGCGSAPSEAGKTRWHGGQHDGGRRRAAGGQRELGRM